MIKHIQNFMNRGGNLVYLKAAPSAEPEGEAAPVDAKKATTKRAAELFAKAKEDYRKENKVDMPADKRGEANKKAIAQALKEHKDDKAYAEGMEDFDAHMAELEEQADQEGHKYEDVLAAIEGVPYTESEKKAVAGAGTVEDKLDEAKRRYEDQPRYVKEKPKGEG